MVGGRRAAAARCHPAGPRARRGGGRRLCRAVRGADPAAAGPAGGGAGCGTHRLGRLLPQRRHGLGRAEGGRRGAREGLRRRAGQGHHRHRRGQPTLHRGDHRARGDRRRLCPLRPLLGGLVARTLRGDGAAGRQPCRDHRAAHQHAAARAAARGAGQRPLPWRHAGGGDRQPASRQIRPRPGRGGGTCRCEAGGRGPRAGNQGRPGRLPHRHRPRRDPGRRGAGHHQRLFARCARHRPALGWRAGWCR